MAERVREAPAGAPPAATRARQRAERARGAMPAFSSSSLLSSSPSPLLEAPAVPAPLFPPEEEEEEEPKSVCVFPAPVWPVRKFFCFVGFRIRRERTRREGKRERLSFRVKEGERRAAVALAVDAAVEV